LISSAYFATTVFAAASPDDEAMILQLLLILQAKHALPMVAKHRPKSLYTPSDSWFRHGAGVHPLIPQHLKQHQLVSVVSAGRRETAEVLGEEVIASAARTPCRETGHDGLIPLQRGHRHGQRLFGLRPINYHAGIARLKLERDRLSQTAPGSAHRDSSVPHNAGQKLGCLRRDSPNETSRYTHPLLTPKDTWSVFMFYFPSCTCKTDPRVATAITIGCLRKMLAGPRKDSSDVDDVSFTQFRRR
jgi:hypothetical protein